MTGDPAPVATTLSGVAAILQAIAWPIIALLLCWIFRAEVRSLMEVVAFKLKQVKRLKAGQVELEIDDLLNQAGERAGGQEIKREIPESQIQAARTVGKKLEQAPIAFSQKLELVHKQVYSLVDQYEELRQDLPSSPARTRAMNEIAAKMRALAIAARPLLGPLMSGNRAGERLAAICTLQVLPELGYFDWLVERITEETQAFLLFHASLAILELVKSHPYLKPDYASEKIGMALRKVKSFPGGPDQNTVGVLTAAIDQLRTVTVSE